MNARQPELRVVVNTPRLTVSIARTCPSSDGTLNFDVLVEEWLRCAEVLQMHRFLKGRGICLRKLRLSAHTDSFLRALQISELFADSIADEV